MRVRKKSIFYLALILGLSVLLGILSFKVPIIHAITNDTVEISVNVTSLSEIVVSPNYLEWLNIQPTQAGSIKTVDVKNTGSVNFTKLWAYVDSYAEEVNNPLGQGNPLLYAAGSFLVLTNETGETGYRFVNRMEWNETEKPTGMTLSPSDSVSWGYFRNLTDIYLWNFNDSATEGECLNGSQMQFKIKTVAESLINPDRNMNSNTVTGTFEENTTEWSSWTFGSGPLANYCVYIHKDCKKMMITQWDWNTTLPSCSKRKYITQEVFTTNAIHTLGLTILVPKGVPVGNTTSSTLTIIAE